MITLNLAPTPPPREVIRENTTLRPLYVAALHRLARFGKATTYAPSGRFVQFRLDTGDRELTSMERKWHALNDAVSVILIYSDESARRYEATKRSPQRNWRPVL